MNVDTDYLQRDVKSYDAQLAAAKDMIQQIDAQIQAEAQRVEKHTQARIDETQAKIATQRSAIQSAEQRIQEIMQKRRTVGLEADQTKQDGEEMDRQIASLQAQIQNCEKTINSAKEKERDKYVPFGRNIGQVLQRIASMKWRGDTPLGPLGQYVTAKDPKTWGETLRSQLAQYLIAFAVTNAADRAQLKKLLVESGK